MQKTNTVSDIFNTAISLEKKAEAFYLDLSNKFSDHPEVSEFWKGMMKDEAQHAQVLQKSLDSLTEEQRLDAGRRLPAPIIQTMKYRGICPYAICRK